MESGYTYPERSDNKLAAGKVHPKAATNGREGNLILLWYYQKSAEVILGFKGNKSNKSEGPNVRIGERTTNVYHVGNSQPNPISELLI